MDVFDLRESLIEQCQSFARSFTAIKAHDIRLQIEQAYDSGRYWHDPLLQINPRFRLGRRVAQVVAAGELHRTCAGLFGIELYLHQENAIALAARRESYVVTTGNGSGESLCFFLPIVDAVAASLKMPPRVETYIWQSGAGRH